MSKRNTKELDMLNGKTAGKLIMFAIPLALSSILQQLFNSADVAVVGRFAKGNAMAAVGSCVALVGIFVNLIVGLSVGPNASLATIIGQKRRDDINGMLHTIITFGAILGIVLMGIGIGTAKVILEISGTPEGVLPEALLYIRIYFISIPFMVIYNFGAAILRSFGDTRRPMFYLIITGAVNVALNLFLVICCKLGVAGVAIATLISNVLSAILVMVYLCRRKDEFKFCFRNMRIESKYLKNILKIGIPAGVQGAIFSISNVFIQSGINSFGEDAIAGSSLALNFEYFTYDISNAFAQAAVTFISQNFGACNIKRCKKIFWQCMAFGLIRMHHVCALEGLTATYEVESAALRGMGKSLGPAIITILGTVVFRIIWLVTVFRLVPTYTMLMNVYIASWIFTGGAIFILLAVHMKKIMLIHGSGKISPLK